MEKLQEMEEPKKETNKMAEMRKQKGSLCSFLRVTGLAVQLERLWVEVGALGKWGTLEKRTKSLSPSDWAREQSFL